MPKNAALLHMCSMYAQASLSSDMAKRIMLSVIPAVQSKTEVFHTGGYDYKALKSAANGAKDVLKYGIRSCIEEIHNIKPAVQIKNIEVKNKIDSIIDLAGSQEYQKSLLLCAQLFNNEDLWQPNFGGRVWANIANVLRELQMKQDQLVNTRALMSKGEGDYLPHEVETMKEIVVLLNRFDQMAHNTASVLDSLAEEELNEWGLLPPTKEQLDDLGILDQKGRIEYRRKIHQKRLDYQKGIRQMMDAKELDDPFDVYKQVQHIIEQPENKHLFGDYIKRIHIDPKFKQTLDPKEVEKRLHIIQSRKILVEEMRALNNAIDALSARKDDLVRKPDDYNARSYAMISIKSALSQADYLIQTIRARFLYFDNKNAYPLFDAAGALRTKLRNMEIQSSSMENGGIPGKGYLDGTELVNDVYLIKQMMSKINGMASDL